MAIYYVFCLQGTFLGGQSFFAGKTRFSRTDFIVAKNCFFSIIRQQLANVDMYVCGIVAG